MSNVSLASTLLTPEDIAAVLLSLKVSVVAVGLSAVPAVLLGTWLGQSRSRLRAVVEAVVVAPLVVPPVVTGLGLLAVVSWLAVPIAFTWWAAMLASAVVSAPLMIRTVRAAVETIDPRLGQVAATLGASRGRVFVTVTLPMIWPAVVGGITLAWVRAMGEFGATMIVAGNIPGKTQTVALAMYTDWIAAGRSPWPLAGLAIVASVVAVGLAEWLIRRASRKRSHEQNSGIQTA